MKPSNTSNEMIQFVAHFDVSKIYEIKKKKKNYRLETLSIVSCSISNTSPQDFSIMNLIVASCPSTKMILSLGNCFDKKTAYSNTL